MEAARELGIGHTKLQELCRTLGITRWPSRRLKSMDKLIESLNERVALEPSGKDVSHHVLHTHAWPCVQNNEGCMP